MLAGGSDEEIHGEAFRAGCYEEKAEMSVTEANGQVASWSRRKKDVAPRGVFRHRTGVWAARFFCGAGHRHQERVGTIKSEAIRVFYERRARAHDEPGWCPTTEHRRARAEQARQVTFRQHQTEYLA